MSTNHENHLLWVRQNAPGIAEGWIEPEGDDDIRDAWQHLHDSGLAYQLQGWFGRTAQDLIAQGLIDG